MFDSAWDAGLDDQQLAAVTHGMDPLVVLAGAGTGKTRTLTSRVAALVDRGVAPERLLLLTFTRRAAEDMMARAASLCREPDAARRLWGGTFHSVAYRLVAEHAQALGLTDFSVLDPGDATTLMDLLREEHGLADTTTRTPRAATLVDIYSRAVNTGTGARDVITVDFPWCEPHTDAVLALLRAYVARKRARSMVDFDDLLLLWRALMQSPVLGEQLVARWDAVLLDEYQDVNQVQVDIVTALRPGGRGLTVVGDEGQAIYGFRGSRASHLAELVTAYPDARVVCLERNFRSHQPVLDLANVLRPPSAGHRLELRAAAGDRGPRPQLVECHDAAQEARLVVDAVLAAAVDGERLRDQAVLMRSSTHSDLLELELTARRVPFVKYGGLRFLEAAHVKDLLATLRVVTNPRDELAWFRLLRLHEGVGPATAGRLLPLLVDPGQHPDANSVVAHAPAAARSALATTLSAVSGARGAPPAVTVQSCLTALRPLLAARYPDAPARLGDLERLATAAAAAATVADFVADVTIDPPRSTSDTAGAPHLDEDYLTLSTIHAAKGLEWRRVHVIHAVDGALPSDMALRSEDGLAEEARLAYVAVTRARDTLTLYTPLRMPHHRRGRDDRHSYAPRSRFLDDAALATLDVVAAPRPAPAPAAMAAHASAPPPDLTALLS